MKLELYFTNCCPYCLRVLDQIQSLKLESVVGLIDLNKMPDKRDQHYKTTGRHTVPCLYIDEKPMFESMDIISWLKNHQADILKS